MGGLYHTLNIGSQALFATRQGVDTAGHNISNAHTEGYSRQRVNLKQRVPTEMHGIVRGNGVFVNNITRAHDKFIEKSLNKSQQDFGDSQTYHRELKSLEDIFSPELNTTTDKEISLFFNSIRDLANMPEDLTVRTAVKESAVNLSDSFRRVDRDLERRQQDVNQRIAGEVDEAARLLRGIAHLNAQIQYTEAGDRQEAGDLRDQQEKMVRDLSQKIEVNYYRGDMGMLVVRGPNESLLVDRNFHANIAPRVREGDNSFFEIVVMDTDGNRASAISRHNSTGSLKALFRVRDEEIPELRQRNNVLAYTLGNAVNSIHRRGYGLNDFKESTGRDFFSLSEDLDTAASSIVISSDIWESTDAISAAMTPSAPGDNVMANELLRLENQKLLLNGNATFNEYYSDYVGQYGLEVVRAKHIQEADEVVLNDIKSQKESVSGVSMDEEAASLLKWQANFTASSRVITTVDEMLETVLSLKR